MEQFSHYEVQMLTPNIHRPGLRWKTLTEASTQVSTGRHQYSSRRVGGYLTHPTCKCGKVR